MGGAYAVGGPWGQWSSRARRCAGERRLDDWLAMMTGRRSSGSSPPAGNWGPFAGAFGPPWASGGHQHRPPKARRGDVRAAILAVLAEESLNGYQIIQEIAERSGGIWKPSPGSIYPTLQQLEDEGLVRQVDLEGRRTFTLTDEGRTYVGDHPDEAGAPWQSFAVDDDREGLKPL